MRIQEVLVTVIFKSRTNSFFSPFSSSPSLFEFLPGLNWSHRSSKQQRKSYYEIVVQRKRRKKCKREKIHYQIFTKATTGPFLSAAEAFSSTVSEFSSSGRSLSLRRDGLYFFSGIRQQGRISFPPSSTGSGKKIRTNCLSKATEVEHTHTQTQLPVPDQTFRNSRTGKFTGT